MSLVINSSSVSSNEYKTHSLVAYILLATGLFTAIPLLFGAIWAMIQKKGAIGTHFHSHLVNATRVFWWSLFWFLLGWATTSIIIGYAILGLAWLWGLYRVLNGAIKAFADEPYPL